MRHNGFAVVMQGHYKTREWQCVLYNAVHIITDEISWFLFLKYF